MKRVGLHGGCRGKTHSIGYLAAGVCLLVAGASPAQVGPLPWPPQFYEYAGPTIAFPDTRIGFTIYGWPNQTNHTCWVSLELLLAPSNTSFLTFGEQPRCGQWSHVSWNTPSRLAIGTTNAFVVRATDQGTPPLSSTTTVSIVIVDVPPIQTISLSNGAPVLQFTNPFAAITNWHSGDHVPGYLVESSTNLAATNWAQSGEILSSLHWITFTDTNAPKTQCFYRLRPHGGWELWYPASGP